LPDRGGARPGDRRPPTFLFSAANRVHSQRDPKSTEVCPLLGGALLDHGSLGVFESSIGTPGVFPKKRFHEIARLSFFFFFFPLLSSWDVAATRMMFFLFPSFPSVEENCTTDWNGPARRVLPPVGRQWTQEQVFPLSLKVLRVIQRVFLVVFFFFLLRVRGNRKGGVF